MPYPENRTAPLVVRIVAGCVGVTVFVVFAAFLLHIARTVAAFHGAGA